MASQTPDIQQRKLEMLLALDDARDALEEDDNPRDMFIAIVEILQKKFEADAIGLMLVNDNSTKPDLIVQYGISQQAAQRLCYEALELREPNIVPSEDWQHVLGMRIMLKKDVLGSLFVARQNGEFSQDDKEIMSVAESQIDSAVIQARRMWQIMHRNRELEAIYQIDRLRDSQINENDLVNGFSAILMEYFDASICMIMLTHVDTGEMIIRGVAGKDNISMAVLDNIREVASNITFPQVIPVPTSSNDIVILAAPLIVSGMRLGSVVVGRKDRFTYDDERLIHAMVTQIDSAIIHSRVVNQLSQRNQELEIIYQIDKIRDQENDLDGMLREVLTSICKTVSSEMGYLMLYNEGQESEVLELRVTTVDILFRSPTYQEIIKQFSRDALTKGELVYSNKPNGPIRSIIAIPLILNEQIIGVFGTVNSNNPRGFSSEDIRMLVAITSQVDTAVFERLERRRLRKVLGRSVDPKVLEHLLQRNNDNVLQGERVTLSVIFADLRGSTAWAERTEPEQLISTLNSFLEKLTDVIFEFGGTLDKFVGDEVIALFGTPIEMENHAYQAISAANKMQQVHKELQKEFEAQGIELPDMGIGISSGEVIVGEIGPPIYTDYTAIGRAMNLGARLCGAAPGNHIYISEKTYQYVENQVIVDSLEPITLKGIGSVSIYNLKRIRGA